jgi:hypothetical protein
MQGALTSLADLEISEKAGIIDMVKDWVSVNLGKRSVDW